MLKKCSLFLIPSIVLVVIPGIISDERTCSNVNMFECVDHSYIDEKYECDGVRNCPDGSDEDCCYCVQKHNGFCCDGYKYIPPYWECDGYLDCADSADETTCGCECYCPYEKQCLPKAWICDKWSNCADRSDEKDCPCDGPNDFLCEDGFCTYSSLVCDGVDHCLDQSDEKYCNSTIRSGVEGVLAPEKKSILRILSESASKKQAKSQGWQK